MKCCICGEKATRIIETRGLRVAGRTLYCDRHAAEMLARATRPRIHPASPDTEERPARMLSNEAFRD